MKKPTREQLVTAIERAILGKAGINGAVEAADTVLALLDEGEPAYPESFAEQPKSILEERANRAAAGADVWSVRDALIACLRDLDTGELDLHGNKPEQVAIIVTTKSKDNGTQFRYFQRCLSTLSLIGMYNTGIFDCHSREATYYAPD